MSNEENKPKPQPESDRKPETTAVKDSGGKEQKR